MIILDTTIVNVALPSIRADLGFDDASLAWVVNAYILTFGGFLLLGGRLGDVFGQRNVFLSGLTLFTGASLLCGLATSQGMLIVARALQGIGGAIMSAVSLALVMTMFQAPAERARAMGFYAFIAAGGGTLGVLLGGVITDALSWQWNFLINVPIGVVALVASTRLLPASSRSPRRLDIVGAALVTSALVIATFAIVNSASSGFTSVETLGGLALSLILIAIFLAVEAKVRDPLVPLSIFKIRGLSVASGVGVLWAAAMYAWFFLSALYMQLVLGYGPLQVGLAFLAPNLIMGAFALGLSAKIVMRYGFRTPIAAGLGLAAVGLGLLAMAPERGTYVQHVLPGMLFLGAGAGLAMNPVMLAAMKDVPPTDSGLASGVMNTAFMTGGALGLAALAALAASRAADAAATGATVTGALTAGYQAAFVAGAVLAAIAALLAATMFAPGRVEDIAPHEAPIP